MKTAVVVGAQGVIGRYITEKLSSLPDCRWWACCAGAARTGRASGMFPLTS